MWTFKDKGQRDVCLIPEVTGIIQEQYRNSWQYDKSKPVKIFYTSRCYRYDRPQLGRYREFTQFGIEILGSKEKEKDYQEMLQILKDCLTNIECEFKFGVARGITYYTEAGFEVECPKLGAQKQIAGGGTYSEGMGWAIGVERLILGRSFNTPK